MKPTIPDVSAIGPLARSFIRHQRVQQLEQWMSIGLDYWPTQLQKKSQQELFTLLLQLILQYRTYRQDEKKAQFLSLFLQQVVTAMEKEKDYE